MDAIATAASGMTTAFSQLDRAASSIASPQSDPAQGAVQLAEAKTGLAANTAVFKTADRMMGALLDMIA